MQTRAATQGTLQYRAPITSVYGRRRKAKTSAASKRTDSRAFLTQQIQGIAFYDSPLMNGVHVDRAFDCLLSSCKKLFSLTGDGFKVSCDGSTDQMIGIINSIEQWAREHDLMLVAIRDADDDINFVLYHEVSFLDTQTLCFFISPAESLPDDTAALYKRFIRFVAACLGISIMPEYSDSRYLDMLLDSEWNSEAEESEIYNLYNEKRVQNLFKEVQDSDIKGIRDDLLSHRKECDPKVLDLVEIMIEGTEILSCISIWNYDFNPYNDGFDDSNGEIELMSTMAVLYSPNDGLQDALVESLNSDLYCGLNIQGWNRWMSLTPDITKDDVDILMADDSIEHRFLDWVGRFYEESVKFDKYKKEEK